MQAEGITGEEHKEVKVVAQSRLALALKIALAE